MTWVNWLPWRFIIRYVARKQGFLDPVALLSRLHGFAQPSEVAEPIELLRAGLVFHARGLINSRVIQHNLDWVWPYWIERQFDPTDLSFIPRAFSITHINLSHRNWTAIGYPGCQELPIVDPRGLLTPIFDGWSLDGWLMAEDGRSLLPSRATDCRQRQEMKSGVCIITETQMNGLALTSSSWVQLESGVPVCKLRLQARSDTRASVVLALRPYNPEGISFIHQLSLSSARDAWMIDDKQSVVFSTAAERHHVSHYLNGDVYIHLRDREDQTEGSCEVGMVTAAALFSCNAGETTEITATIPLATKPDKWLADDAWQDVYQNYCKLSCPDERYQFLYDAAITSLILHSPEEVYPGPYTYKRFWFRDAAFIIHALLCTGLTQRAERALACFPSRQTSRGYFRSQEGEWDSNGEALWILERFFALTNRTPAPEWREPVRQGARWIQRKRLGEGLKAPHAGLLPAGFSAEHLGPNDYYYWDDFWGIAGLRAASTMLARMDADHSQGFASNADSLAAAVDRSLATCVLRVDRPAMPASPYRRLDSGSIGSLAVGYPLQLCAPDDPRLLDSIEFLHQHCFVRGTFYQDMTHSGLNPYLTLHVAQVMLRAGDPRHLELMDAVADLASPTGHWPEACHPWTGGGCMGDGHHVWASAEWVLMIRNCFVREEGKSLILVSGIPGRWLEQATPIRFGPAPTTFGTVSITINPDPNGAPRVDWRGNWHGEVPRIEIRLPGFAPVDTALSSGSEVLMKRET